MPGRLFQEWYLYSQLDPWGGIRGDVQAAIIAATQANSFRGKGQAPARVADFMPQFDEKVKVKPRQMSTDQIRAVLKQAARAGQMMASKKKSR